MGEEMVGSVRRRGTAYVQAALTVCALLGSLAQTACQSSSPGDVLNVDPSAKQQVQPVVATAVQGSSILGSGPVRLAVVVSSEVANAGKFSDVRNGADLAIQQLGGGDLSVEVLQAGAGDISINEKAVEAYVKGAAAIAYVGRAPATSAGNTLQLALVSNAESRPQGGLAFLASPADSVEAGILQTASAGAKSIFLIAPSGQNKSGDFAAAVARMKSSAAVTVVEYAPNESPAFIAAKVTPSPGAVVAFAGNGPEITGIAAALSAKAGQSGSLQFIGNSAWAGSSLLAAPALQGSLVAIADSSNERLVADRYRQTFGQVPSQMALQVYDAVAIIAGINRAKGVQGFSDGTIRTPSGFKGATGAFRFRQDGSVERLFALKKVSGGKLVQLSAAPAGF